MSTHPPIKAVRYGIEDGALEFGAEITLVLQRLLRFPPSTPVGSHVCAEGIAL